MKKLYYIYDEVGDINVTDIITMPNDILAMRGFMSFLEKAPAEKEVYTLYCVGEWDESLGINTIDIIHIVATGKDVEEKYKNFIKTVLPEDEETENE